MNHFEADEHGITYYCAHPALELRHQSVNQLNLPNTRGLYTLIAGHTSYVGQADRLSRRVPTSIKDNLPGAFAVITINPPQATGFTWDRDALTALEYGLIQAIPSARANRKAGPRTTDPYLEAVVSTAARLINLVVPTSNSRRRTQVQATRELVEARRDRPWQMNELIDELITQGYVGLATARTPWFTIRRDLCDTSRGGTAGITFDAPLQNNPRILYPGYRYGGAIAHPATSATSIPGEAGV